MMSSGPEQLGGPEFRHLGYLDVCSLAELKWKEKAKKNPNLLKII